MTEAASRGHENSVRAMLDCGANNYNSTMVCAASCGHENIVRLMLEKGADNFEWVMNIATRRKS